MNATSRVFLVIPAFNPGEAVIGVVREALPLVDVVVLVDDGCEPQQRAHLDSCLVDDKVKLLAHGRNLGKGHALRTGMQWCLERMEDTDFILTMDSDGQHRSCDIRKFRDLINSEPGVNFALGERLDSSRMPRKSRVGNYLARLAFRLQYGGRIYDTQTGFRLFSRTFAQLCNERIRPGRFETEMNVLILATRVLNKIHSVSIPTIYFQTNRNSKFDPIRDSLRITRLFVNYGAVSLASFLVDYLIFVLLTYALGIAYLIANVIARIFSAAVNFVAHKRLSFESREGFFHEALKYVGAVAFALAQASLLLFISVDVFHVSKYIAKPAVDMIVFVVNFLVLSRVVFRRKIIG
jgi:putative flippase GtrA